MFMPTNMHKIVETSQLHIYRIIRAYTFRSHACIHIHTYAWLVLGFSSIQSSYSFCCLYTHTKKDKYQRKVTLTPRDVAKGRDPNNWWENQLFPKPRTRQVTHSRAIAASESGQLGILWEKSRADHLMPSDLVIMGLLQAGFHAGPGASVTSAH